MKKLIFLLLLAVPALLHAQTNLGRTKSRWRQEKRADPTLAHLQALENAVAAQQQQIQQLTNELKLGEDFIGGIYMASGANLNGVASLTDPISTNETLTTFFERKTVGFDRGYVIFQPQAAKWIKLTGGKFAYDWEHTDLTFDPDLNPEGFTEKLSFDFNNPLVK